MERLIAWEMVIGLLLLLGNDAVALDQVQIDSSKPLAPITAIDIDDNNQLVITGGQAAVDICSLNDLRKVKQLPTKLDHIHDIALAPDGTLLAIAGGVPSVRGVVELYHWPSGEPLRAFDAHTDLVYAISWSEDSQRFVTASADRGVKCFDRESSRCLHEYHGHSRPVLAVTYLPGIQGFVSAGIDETLRVWEENSVDASKVVASRNLTQHTKSVTDLAVLQGQDQQSPVIVSASEDRTVRFWQAKTGRMVRFAKIESPPLAVCWTADGKYVVAACKDGVVRLIDPIRVEVIDEEKVMNGPAYCIACSKQGHVVVGGVQSTVKLIRKSWKD